MATSTKPAKGMRDLLPRQMLRRERVVETIKRVYRSYGFEPLETPACERLEVLLGKYGEEGDQLVFKILQRGEQFAKAVAAGRTTENELADMALRYDLTVPLARVVAEYQNDLPKYFKRYQIQPVWRADRPQKGRYREFFQCDVDVIGSDSLLNEYELIKIIDEIFCRLGISVVVKVNNRKVLTGIAEIAGVSEKVTDITVAIDKIEKIGIDAVINELKGKGISDNAIAKLKPVLDLKGNSNEKFIELEEMLMVSEAGKQGIAELKTLFGYVE